MARPVIVIGLDGADWAVLDKYMALGVMPNLKRLCEEGYRATLRSTIPPVSPTAWASFATGTSPGKHGILGFVAPRTGEKEYRKSIVRSDRIAEPTLWQYFSGAGLQSIVLQVPVSYPPLPLNGFLVTGMFTPSQDSECTYPASLKAQLRDADCMPRFHAEVESDGSEPSKLRRVDDATDMTHGLLKTVKHLARHPWNLLVAVFYAPDRLQHQLWDEVVSDTASEQVRRRIRDCYAAMDEAVGQIVSLGGDEAVSFVMSDHGFGRCKGQFALGRWLADQGWMTWREKTSRPGLRTAKRIAKALGLTSVFQRWAQDSSALRTVLAETSPVDWTRSQAFPEIGLRGIRINLKGREPNGVVEPGRPYEQLRAQIREALLALRVGPDSHRVVDQVWYPEQVYSGPYTHLAADLILGPDRAHGYDLVCGAPDGGDLVFESPLHAGSHRRDGVFLAAGPVVRAGRANGPLDIVDIAPTVLRLADLAVPLSMDGRVIEEAFEGVDAGSRRAGDSSPSPREVQQDSGDYSEEEQRAIEKRLKDLGYL